MLRSSDSSTQGTVRTIYCRLFTTFAGVTFYAFLSIHLISKKLLYRGDAFRRNTESILPLSASHSASPLSYLTPLPPALLSPRLLPNGGISLQPSGLTLLFCTGRTHFMLYDYISLPAIWDRISLSVWGAHKCVKNSIKYIYIYILLLQCIPADQQTIKDRTPDACTLFPCHALTFTHVKTDVISAHRSWLSHAVVAAAPEAHFVLTALPLGSWYSEVHELQWRCPFPCPPFPNHFYHRK